MKLFSVTVRRCEEATIFVRAKDHHEATRFASAAASCWHDSVEWEDAEPLVDLPRSLRGVPDAPGAHVAVGVENGMLRWMPLSDLAAAFSTPGTPEYQVAQEAAGQRRLLE